MLARACTAIWFQNVCGIRRNWVLVPPPPPATTKPPSAGVASAPPEGERIARVPILNLFTNPTKDAVSKLGCLVKLLSCMPNFVIFLVAQGKQVSQHNVKALVRFLVSPNLEVLMRQGSLTH